ncbi:MAG: hypothetical protein NC311_03025 [Muribaculaceae bacterium]|nr:hypothetical protein [Muribaculaceae bacterium]
MKKFIIFILYIYTISAHGAFLHIGDKKILLTPHKTTTPSLAAAIGDKIVYTPMSQNSTCKLCTIYNETKYNIGITVLDYLYFDGSQHIDLGFPPSAELQFEIKAWMDNTVPNHDGCLLGARSGLTGLIKNGQYLVWYTNATNYCDGAPHILTAFGNHTYTEIIVDDTPQTIRWYNDTLTVNDKTIENIPTLSETPTTNNLSLGAVTFNSKTDSRKFMGRVYYARFWRNDTLIMNLIPVLDAADTPTFYDTVSNKFFYNSGTGQFKYNIE